MFLLTYPTDLEKSMTRDSLKSHLTKRPSRETLVQRNILSESTAAPTIQAGLRELERSMVQDSLKEKLLHRPAPEAVVERGILSRMLSPIQISSSSC